MASGMWVNTIVQNSLVALFVMVCSLTKATGGTTAYNRSESIADVRFVDGVDERTIESSRQTRYESQGRPHHDMDGRRC